MPIFWTYEALRNYRRFRRRRRPVADACRTRRRVDGDRLIGQATAAPAYVVRRSGRRRAIVRPVPIHVSKRRLDLAVPSTTVATADDPPEGRSKHPAAHRVDDEVHREVDGDEHIADVGDRTPVDADAVIRRRGQTDLESPEKVCHHGAHVRDDTHQHNGDDDDRDISVSALFAFFRARRLKTFSQSFYVC